MSNHTIEERLSHVARLTEVGYPTEDIAALLRMPRSAVLWYKQISDERHEPKTVPAYLCDGCQRRVTFEPCQICRALRGRKSIQKSGFGIRGDEEK